MTGSKVKLYRVTIEDVSGGQWHTRVEADTKTEARRTAKRESLLLGDRITAIEGPYVVWGRARFAHGWIEKPTLEEMQRALLWT